MEMFIEGRWCASETGLTLPVSDPRGGGVVGHVPDASPADAGRAIASCAAAFDTWSKTPMSERVRIQKACAQAMRDHAETVGLLLHQELGRPMAACIG